jgi:nucleoid-associated protein YgaU
MAFPGTSKLSKMVISAFKDPKMPEGTKAEKTYVALVNPKSYTQSYKVEYIAPEKPGGETPPKYQWTPPSDMEFEFIFDATGILKASAENETSIGGGSLPLGNTTNIWKKKEQTGVEEDIKKFLDVVYSYDGDIHRPYYLKISWGTLVFSCVLAEVSIEYKLFAPDGKPLRAAAKAKFRKFKDEELLIAEEKKSSPDLTHIRVAEAGDTLPLMTKRIYGDAKYYLEVARANKLHTFRKLRAGQRIFFPPLQKPQ